MLGGRTAIRRFGSRCLRRRAQPVDPAAPETVALVERLWEALATQEGVGLAAPQIGELRRVVVVAVPVPGGTPRRLALANPEIRRTFGPLRSFREGCLSFPGLYADVDRPAGVELEYDEPGTPPVRRQVRDDDLLARIVQHERDHLDGVLFVDHLNWGQRLAALPRLALIVIRGWLRL